MACPPVVRALLELYHEGGWLLRSWVQLGWREDALCGLLSHEAGGCTTPLW